MPPDRHGRALWLLISDPSNLKAVSIDTKVRYNWSHKARPETTVSSQKLVLRCDGMIIDYQANIDILSRWRKFVAHRFIESRTLCMAM
jgi:hypothetical protein